MKKKFVVILCVILVLGLTAGSVQAATPEEIEDSIELGLTWLDSQQMIDGSWDYNPGITGLALLKFEDRAKELGLNPLGDDYAYHTTVQDGLNNLFSQMSVSSDTITIGGSNYYTSIALIALSASNNPDTVVDVTGSAVDGMTYAQVAQGLLNWVIAAQPTSGCAEGGWGYGWADPGWADQSNAGYSVLSLTQAQAPSPEGFGLTIPPSTKTELLIFLENIQVESGGSSYNPCWIGVDSEWVNILKTGSLLQEHAFAGTPETDPAVLDATGYIENHWNDAGPHPDYTATSLGWKDSYQSMFCMMKGLESYNIDELDLDNDGTPEADWFDEVSTLIIAHQNADGSFQWINDGTGFIGEGDDNANLRAAWALLTLEKFVPPSRGCLDITKSANPTTVTGPSQTITYEYEVCNCGDSAIDGISVTDSRDLTVTSYATTLAIGQCTTGTATYTTTVADIGNGEPICNTATVTGTDEGDISIDDTTESPTCVDIESPPVIPVEIDIKPGSCPNGFNRYEKGSLPVAIVGTSEIDVKTVDPNTITLNGVKATKWSYKDTATPYLGTAACGCHALTGDGVMDLMVYFPTTEVAGTLPPAQIKDIVGPLNLSGLLKDGITSIDGNDCVKISK